MDYGIIGIALVGITYAFWYLFKKQEKYSDGWKEQSEKMSTNFITLVTEQNKTNQRLIDIREKDVQQHKEFYESIKKDIQEIPSKTVKEMNYNSLQNLKHNTPAG